MNSISRQALPFFANAILSGASGALLLFMPALVGEWLGWGHELIFRVLGAGLMLFAVALVWIAAKPAERVRHARLASMADFAWVALTPAVCWVLWDSLTLVGVTMLVMIAVSVELLGSWQWWVTRRA